MDDKVYKFRLGVVVAAAAAILVLLIMLMGDLPKPLTSRYDIFVDVPAAPGVSVGTPVRKSGINIGRVKDVQFLDDGSGVRLTLQIDGNRQIYDDEQARITTASLLGDAVVEFYRPVPRAISTQPIQRTGSQVLDRLNLVAHFQPPERRPIPAGEVLKGEVATTPTDVVVNLEVEMKEALRSIKAAGDKINSLADNFNGVIGENQDSLPRILEGMERSLGQFDKTMLSMQDVFGDDELRGKIKATLTEMPEAISDARMTMSKMQQSFESIGAVAIRADKNLENLEKFTGPLGERGPQIASNIESSIAKVDALFEQLVEFSERLNSREGTLSRLLDDDEIYNRLARTLMNVEDVTRELRPVIDNFKVASDKVARDPGILGVRGALDRRPVGQGTKGLFMDYEQPTVSYKVYSE